MRDDELAPYFAGTALYGDDFDAPQRAAWYADEAEGYADLGAADKSKYAYAYHALNAFHGVRHLPRRTFPRLMGFGAAYGDELLPWLAQAAQVTIVDPSQAFASDRVHGRPACYVQPSPEGVLPLADAQFDLVTCLGVLHHIPNVSFVMTELARVLAPGGWLLLREPINSMGDWRRPRRGLTKRERGIPLPILQRMVKEAGLSIHHQSLCAFPLTHRLFKPIRSDPFNSAAAVRLDAWMSRLFAANVNYHPASNWQRLKPTSAFLVIHKAQP